jgi:hypothetical protein
MLDITWSYGSLLRSPRLPRTPGTIYTNTSRCKRYIDNKTCLPFLLTTVHHAWAARKLDSRISKQARHLITLVGLRHQSVHQALSSGFTNQVDIIDLPWQPRILQAGQTSGGGIPGPERCRRGRWSRRFKSWRRPYQRQRQRPWWQPCKRQGPILVLHLAIPELAHR